MICPDNDLDCDNVGCRRGGCQGRRPRPPLLRTLSVRAIKALPLLEPEIAGGATALQTADRADQDSRRRQLVVA